MTFEIIKVEGYSGYRPDERPMSFIYNGRQHEVRDILERWYESSRRAGNPIYAFFKVITEDGDLFLLRYNSRFRTWAILTD